MSQHVSTCLNNLKKVETRFKVTIPYIHEISHTCHKGQKKISSWDAVHKYCTQTRLPCGFEVAGVGILSKKGIWQAPQSLQLLHYGQLLAIYIYIYIYICPMPISQYGSPTVHWWRVASPELGQKVACKSNGSGCVLWQQCYLFPKPLQLDSSETSTWSSTASGARWIPMLPLLPPLPQNQGSISYFCSGLLLVRLKLMKIQPSLGLRFFLRWYFKHLFTFSDEFATQTSWSHESTTAEACAVVSLGLRTWNQPWHSQLQTEGVIECANKWFMGSFG